MFKFLRTFNILLFSIILITTKIDASNIDLLHYDVVMEIIPSQDKIVADVKIKIRNKDEKISQLSFTLFQEEIFHITRKIKVEFVKLKERKTTFTQNSSLTGVNINLLEPLLKNQEIELRIKYQLIGNFLKNEQNCISIPHPLPYPVEIFLNEKDFFTFNLLIKVPKGLTVISMGILKKVINQNKYTMFNWQSKVPYCRVSLYLGPYKEKYIFNKNIKISYYYLPKILKNPEEIDGRLKITKDILNYFSKIFCKYPFEKLAIIVGAPFPALRTAGGYANQSLIVFRSPYDISYDNPSTHEIAHQWWGMLVSFGTNSRWLDEALATYSGMLYIQKYGMKKGVGGCSFNEMEELLLPLIRNNLEPQLTMLFSDRIFHFKPQFFLRMLSYLIGDDNFLLVLKTMVKEYQVKIVTLNDFIRICEKVSGQKLRWFFKQWVDTKGCLKYKFSEVKVNKLKDKYKVSFKLLQEKYIFKMPVEILLHTKKKNYIQKVWIESLSTDINFEVKERPLYLQIDPNHWLLIDYPTPFSTAGEVLVRMRVNQIIVYGTQLNEEDTLANKKEAENILKFSKGVIKSDEEVTEDELKDGHLYLIGGAALNKIVAKLNKQLPIQFDGNYIIFEGKKYTDKDIGLLMCCANPLNLEKGIFIRAGVTKEGVSNYPQKVKQVDYCIYKGKNTIKTGSFPKKKVERLIYYLNISE